MNLKVLGSAALAAALAAGCAALATPPSAPQVIAPNRAAADGPAPRLHPMKPGGACEAAPVTPEDGATTFGRLTYLDGYRLVARTEHFGGLSALQAQSDGALIAATDAGRIATLELTGDPAAPVRCGLASLQDAAGAALSDKNEADSEGVARLADGRLAISFERDHRVETYPALASDATALSADGGIVRFDHPRIEGNRGLEALTVLPSGALLAGAESPTLLGAWHPVWRLAPDPATGTWAAPGEPAFEISADAGFGLVGFDTTPRGNVVVLERFYAREVGNRIKIGWLSRADAETATGRLHVRELARLSLSDAIPVDNFEGITAVAGADGRTEIWIVSDDNFNGAQKILLYRFAFDEDALASG